MMSSRNRVPPFDCSSEPKCTRSPSSEPNSSAAERAFVSPDTGTRTNGAPRRALCSWM